MNIMFIMKITYPWHFAIVPYFTVYSFAPIKIFNSRKRFKYKKTSSCDMAL